MGGLTLHLDQALAWLESHVNLEAIVAGRVDAPSLARMQQLAEAMGDPQHAYPVVHLTGTNGKGSTARMLTALFTARGLSVGTYTSPDLERINERLAWNGEPVDDSTLAELLTSLADLEIMCDEKPSRFELLTAAAFRWFADIAVDVAVIEVGLGGRWDATNVADASVAVVTNVALDHSEIIGPTLADISAEKAGIIKPGSVLVLGETDPELAEIFVAAEPAAVWRRGPDFGCDASRIAHGGRLVDLRTPAKSYDEVYLPVHGSHQGDNAACALAAAEAFFGGPLADDVVSEAFASVRVPGRMEVVGHQPLCVLDGAHNPAGAAAAAVTLEEEFDLAGSRVLVTGMLKGRDAAEMLRALGTTPATTRVVIACPPPSPRAIPPAAVAAAATALGVDAEVAQSPGEALSRALALADPDDLVLVTGSLYLVGAARSALLQGVG